ncbi:MAG: vWA domain-containing protein [Myxococcota bacterium]
MRWVTGTAVAAMLAGCVEYDPASGLQPGVIPGPDEVPEGYALETFEGGGQSTVDVLVVGDTSGSMDEELRTLGDTITRFVDRLASIVDDWQLAAVTDGSGCTASGTLTPSTGDYAERFADALVDPIGDDSEAEMGLRNVTQVLRDADRGCNEGILRGGLLQIVFVTDENDESPGYDEALDYWRDYLDEIGSLHGDPTRVKISAVAGSTPQGCKGADPGFGYDGPSPPPAASSCPSATTGPTSST